MGIIKRILKIIIWVICLPLLFPAVFCIPIMGIYSLLKYVITGQYNEDILFTPMEWVINLPYNITKKL